VANNLQTSCCIAGGGPAGMMLGFLLARSGVDVIVIEKHPDFLRDFRGDTIHPSTLELMYELDLLDQFLKRPHQQVTELGGQISGQAMKLADFSQVPTHCKFLALMPQWDFLNFLVEQGKRYSSFHVLMQTEAVGLIEENGRVAGVNTKTADGEMEIRAALTVGADGRRSLVRDRSGLEVIDLGAPMDIVWFRLSRRATDPPQTLGYVQSGRILVMINRDDYWQCGYVIAKGAFEGIREKGLDNFRRDVARLALFLSARTGEVRDWNDVSLLTVKVDRLRHWSRPGLLCIGDAAHAMSPIGGVGINLAIQDAVAAANILGPKLAANKLGDHDLEAVQKRRELPTRITQKAQVLIQNNVIGKVLASDHPLSVPWPFKLLQAWPFLRRIPARMIGMGFRPEHIHTPESPLASVPNPSSHPGKAV